MVDIDKLEKLGTFAARHWLAVVVGLILGVAGTMALYEKFVLREPASQAAGPNVDARARTQDPGLTAEEQTLLETFQAHRESSTLMVELALRIFEQSKDGTPSSYYVMADLTGLIDQPTILADIEAGGDVSVLRRFISSIANHQKTYGTTSHRRPQDPGFYRHYVVGTAFHKLSASFDADRAEARSAREWAVLFYARFLGNINTQRLKDGKYSGTVNEAVSQARARALALGPEVFAHERAVASAFTSAVQNRRFNAILDLVRGTWGQGRTLEEILRKPPLESDRLWTAEPAS